MKPANFFLDKATEYLNQLNELSDFYIQNADDWGNFENKNKWMFDASSLAFRIKILLSEFDNPVFKDRIYHQFDQIVDVENLSDFKYVLEKFIKTLLLYRIEPNSVSSNE